MNKQKNQTVLQLAELARTVDTEFQINWDKLDVSKDELYLTMAANVLTQIESVPEDQRLAVAMAAMTKLLVENFAISLELRVPKKESE